MDWLLSLAVPWGYLLVFLLALAESGGFVGLLLPGEVAMLLGGVLVYQGRAELAWMLAAGCLGTPLGDSLGFFIGRRLGPRLESSRLGRKVGDRRWHKARGYLRANGGKAVFFGRFIGVLRALLPVLAGSAGVPYARFLPYSIAGGVVWAGGFIVLGYLAGGSWHIVEAWAGRASLILLILAGIVLGLVRLAGWLGSHLPELRARRDDFLQTSSVMRFIRRYRRQIHFLGRRFSPTASYGLYMTVGMLLAVGGLWIFGAILEDIEAANEVALVDRPGVSFLARHREPALNAVMRGVTVLGTGAFTAGVLGLAAAYSYARTRDTRWPAFFAATIVGALLLDDIVKVLVQRPRPDLSPLVDASGFAFPSGHSTSIVASGAALSYYFSTGRGWRATVWIWTAASLVAIVVGTSRVYLGVHWPTDVLGGWSLGGFWVAVAGTGANVLADLKNGAPSPPEPPAR